MEENTFLKGWFKIDHFDKHGNLIETQETPNAVMNLGFKEVACLIGTDILAGHTAFDYIAVGTGVGAATATDTTLGTETTAQGLTRAVGTGTNVTTTVAYDTFQLVNSFSPTDSVAVTESGVLNASSAGVLLCRQTFSAINVTNGDTLTITWKVKVA
ncbi:MAG: hypothetical protein ABIB43_01735 [archaeon]